VFARDDEPPDAGDPAATGERHPPTAERYVLRLYVTGMTPRSCRAIRNLQTICEERLEGRYDLDVIDIYQQPILTIGEQIIAAPTLIKKLPLPMRRLVGDMSDRERVLRGLDLVTVPISRK
jgi:circadian clock protein KaiB